MNIIGVHPSVMWSQDHFLRKPSRELTRDEVLTPAFRQLVEFLLASLYEAPTGVGLAAPQVGLQLRVVVIDIKRNGKKPLVLINPTFEPVSEEMVDSTETCLSFPELAGSVKRYKAVRVRAKDMNFEDMEFESDSFLGIVCQHEIDHLNGQVYVDKTEHPFQSKPHYAWMAERAMEALS